MSSNSYQADERQARRISLVLTVLFMVVLSVLAYLWVLFRGTIPPQDENPYIVVGQLDFGEGLPSAGAASAPALQAPSPPAEQPVITSPAPAPIKEAPSEPTPTPSAEPSSEEAESDEADRFIQEDASSESDLGAGMFEFGEGQEGLQNRKLLYYVLPRYNVQKEGRIKYELYILPDGRVDRVRALTVGAAPELKRAGEEAILQWRFSPISSNQVQRVTVTIRFRLR